MKKLKIFKNVENPYILLKEFLKGFLKEYCSKYASEHGPNFFSKIFKFSHLIANMVCVLHKEVPKLVPDARVHS